MRIKGKIGLFLLCLFSLIIIGGLINNELKIMEKNLQFCKEKGYEGVETFSSVLKKDTFVCYKSDEEGFVVRSKEKYWED